LNMWSDWFSRKQCYPYTSPSEVKKDTQASCPRESSSHP
jgi:hypothetical protein